jgi:hypothetical protein
MTAHVNRILTTGLSHEGLSDVTEKILSIIKERFAAEQPQIGPLVVKVQNDWVGLKEALTRIFRSPLTPEIQTNHTRRVESVVAFHYLLRIKLKASAKPGIAKAGQEVKAVLVNSGLWKCAPTSHQYTSSLIANMIQVFSVPRYREMLATLGMVEAFEELVACDRQYGALQTRRFEEKAGVTTPRIVVARKRLLENLNALVLFIAANASIDPAVYGAAAEQIGSAVRETNAVTRSGKTRRDNAATLTSLSDRESEEASDRETEEVSDRETEEASDRETEQVEAAINGQGSTSAGGAAEHAAFTPQGNPVTGVTLETNPLAPPMWS